MNQPIITAEPDVMGGTPVFAGTRVPVQTLMDYLKGGESIGDFLEGFPLSQGSKLQPSYRKPRIRSSIWWAWREAPAG